MQRCSGTLVPTPGVALIASAATVPRMRTKAPLVMAARPPRVITSVRGPGKARASVALPCHSYEDHPASAHGRICRGDLAMRAEHGPVSRVEELAPGTRVRLAPGRLGTLREVNFTRAIVELDRGEARLREIAPGCEVEV